MKNIYLSLFFVGLMGLTGCSSSEPVNANKPVPTIPANVSNSNTENNTQTVIMQEGNANGPANNTAIKTNVQIITPGKVTGASRPASDNSEIFTELKELPIETRVFKNHPQLIKVVKTGMPGKMTIKVYLKGGKVVDVPGDKFPNLAAETAASILAEVGIKAPAPPASGRPADTKKSDQKQ
jgi:hypothetical protein